ncbi:MAG: RluA family pseudouridine synthase [Muribaculaceae bacterium]|nr:RluA family pseudouridine synthase [Muribaculaceae bacterium]
MNNPFDYRPDKACEEAFKSLIQCIKRLKENPTEANLNFIREIDAGKMLGVLIASDAQQIHHALYAFSGQLGGGGFNFAGFVGPVFDYLEPEGYFKRQEADISRLNIEIKKYESEILPGIRSEYEKAMVPLESEVTLFREKCRRSKAERAERRRTGGLNAEDEAEMIRQSQFEKAELQRLKKRLALRLEPFSQSLREAEEHLEFLKAKRRKDSEDLQDRLFSDFILLNAKGENKSLKEIFADTSFGIPPSGAGECCGPKLLQEAYRRGWKPEAMAEYWYGKPKGGEVRLHGMHYPACRGKCLPVLGWMLQGLDVIPPLTDDFSSQTNYEPEIVFENQWFCVLEKPSGMLSVPGKGHALSLEQWLTQHYGSDKDVKLAHRLDRDTSGLVIAAFGEESLKIMRKLFATRNVKKTYLAELEGDYRELGHDAQGCIRLPLAPDYLDRPRQLIDFVNGKEALTYYEFSGVSEGRSRIIFHPHTGRTHQLRVHAASEAGLGMPIVGDPLYGLSNKNADRLRLHSFKIEFTFPVDNRRYTFESKLEPFL